MFGNKKEEIEQDQIKSQKVKKVILFLVLGITGVMIFGLTRCFQNEFIIYASRVLWFVHAICVSAYCYFPTGKRQAAYEMLKLEYILLGVKIVIITAYTLFFLFIMLSLPGVLTIELAIYAITTLSWNNIFRSIDRIISNIKR